MKKRLIKIFRTKSNLIETIKITVLIAGITFGIARDFSSSDGNNTFEFYQKYQREFRNPVVNISIPNQNPDKAPYSTILQK